MNVIDWSHREMDHQTSLHHIHLCLDWSPHQSALHLLNILQTTFATKIGGCKILGLDSKGLVFQGDGSLYISNPAYNLQTTFATTIGGCTILGLDSRGLVFQGDGSRYISNPVTGQHSSHSWMLDLLLAIKDEYITSHKNQ